jgi:hypothetical protein
MQDAVAGYRAVTEEIDLVSMSSVNENFIWSLIIDQVSNGATFSTWESARKQDQGICDENRLILCSVPDCEARYCFTVGRLWLQ